MQRFGEFYLFVHQDTKRFFYVTNDHSKDESRAFSIKEEKI